MPHPAGRSAGRDCDLRDQRLVLIDGAAFARLMIDYGVGVEVKDVYKVAKIDQDFFADDE